MNHIQRMQVEKEELDEKLKSLTYFILVQEGKEPGVKVVNDEQLELLKEQKEAMYKYSKVLGKRIENDTKIMNAK